MKKEIEAFIEKIRELENDMNRKASFCREHKFNKEADFINGKCRVASEIRLELKSVLSGHKKGENAKFIID